MTIAFVQAFTGIQFNNSAGGSTAAKTITAGNFLGISTTSSVATWTVTTTPSNTIAQANAPTQATSTDYLRLQYVENAGSGSTTVNLSVAGGSYTTICAAEWSGLATSSSLDQHNISASGNSANLLSASVTTTQADELLLGHGSIGSADAAWVAGASYTMRSTMPTGSLGGENYLEERIVSSTGSYTAPATKNGESGFWIAGIATFKAAGGGSNATTTPSTIAVPTTFGAPVGQLSAQPTTIAVPTSFGTPTGKLTAQPATIAVPTSFGAPTILTGTVTAPTTIAVPTSFGAPTLTATAAIAPATIAVPTTFGAPTVLTGTVASPATIAVPTTFGAPVMHVGTTLVMGTILVNTIIGLPSIVIVVTVTGTIFRPPVVHDRSYGPERLWRHVTPAGRGVNVFQLADGSYTETEPPPGTVILHTYLGGHDNPIDATERASLTAAGYGDGIV